MRVIILNNYNATIVNNLKDTFNKPNNITVSNVIVKIFQNQLQDLGVAVPENLNLHSVLSRVGYKLEAVIVEYCKLLNNDVEVHLGDDIKNEVKAYKKTQDDVLRAKLINDYLVSDTYLNTVSHLKNFHFPDIVLIDKKNNVVKCLEVKSSGENDSTSVPGNINKMVAGTNHYAANAWEDTPNITLYKGIAIAAAKRYVDKDNVYPVRNRWENVISEKQLDIDVVVNEEIINWLIGTQLQYDDYLNNVISTACRIEAELVKDNL